MKHNTRHNVQEAGRERISMLLAKAFLGFAAAILVITVFVYWLSGQYYEELCKAPNIEEMRRDEALNAGNYKDVYIDQYLGADGAFAVTTTSGHMMYRSSDIIRPYFTAGELDCIETYGQNSYVEYMSFSFRDGSQQYVFIKHSFTEQNEEIAQMMILDDAYHVISGGFGDGKQFYTPTEVSFLSGTALSGYDYQKCYIMGGNLVLLIVTPEQGAAYFAELMDQAEKIYLLLIPLYIAAFAAFLYWVSRKIRHPLEKLNEAIGNFSIGDEVKTGQLEGPLEISQLGRTFDRMAEELAESERKRNEMDMARKKMMADISHDLKTPITVISGYIRAITDGKIPPEEQGAYLEMIDKRSRRLVTLIDSFHELSKVEHPDFTLKKERLDGFEYMRSYLADRYNEILFHKFDLDVDIPEEEEQHVPIDTLQLRRALDNVLYNSLRHNPPGTILTVKVSSVQEEGACWIRISIGDNGLGIPPEKRDHIFEPFIQGDDARSGGGSGLGLAISRSIIEAHGGRISLCSRDGSPFSTEFEILLPAAEK